MLPAIAFQPSLACFCDDERPWLCAGRDRPDVASPLQKTLGGDKLRRVGFESYTLR
jgi:hypothetical protein